MQGLSPYQLLQPDRRILLREAKRLILRHRFFLLATIVVIQTTRPMSETFHLRSSFVTIVEKRVTKKLFVLPSSRNESNSGNHGKIWHNQPLPLHQRARQLKLPLRDFNQRGASAKLLRRRSIKLPRRKCSKHKRPKSIRCKAR